MSAKRDLGNIGMIIGHHPKMAHILKIIEQVADSDVTFLITGESGTGKELIARTIHFNSTRKEKPFIPINCGALPENLLESELFGYKKGAFTDAVKDKIGWFKKAQQGTIFLDEVSEMTPGLQVKLLRVLQSGEYSQVGGTEILNCNVRIITATNQNLNMLVKEGRFREDLFYRLNVINIDLPPLRERKTDIPSLITHFLTIYNSTEGCKKSLSKEVEKILLDYDYPGNIRELENAIHRALILSESNVIESWHLPELFLRSKSIQKNNIKANNFSPAEKVEQEFIIFCLEKSEGKICQAAELFGSNVSSFYRMMKKYAIDPHDFKK